MSPASDPRTELLLCLGDSNLVLAQQLGALVGWAPTLEEEVALANIGLDLLGHATMLLDLAAAAMGEPGGADALAYLRDAGEFRNVLLAERPADDFAHVVLRQTMFDLWMDGLWRALTSSSDRELAAIAAKATKETAYHVEHAGAWVVRLADGTEESRRRLQDAIDALWPSAGELFEDAPGDAALVEAGVMPALSSLEAQWRERLAALLAEGGIAVPDAVPPQRGGRHGVHTEHLGHLLAELQFLQRAYPGAVW